MVARAAPARRVRRAIALLGIVTALLATVTALADADDHDAGPPPVRGAIDLLASRDGSTRVVGWVLAPDRMAPVVRIVVDGNVAPRFRPTRFRYDVARVIPGGHGAWGWDLTLDRDVRSSLCISAVVDGSRRGLSCWSRDDGVLLPAIGGGPRLGSSGPLIRYSIEVEAETGVHPEDLAREVDAVLADPRSWAANGDARFERVKPGRADLRIVLATPATTDRLCFPFLTGGQLSCNRFDELIVFNIDRWRDAVPHWTASLAEYRAYLVNHEVGHALDFRHVGCPGQGMLAPLMMQQSKSLGGCLPNGWPYPEGPTCLGEPATIVVVPGQPVVGTGGDDVILGTPTADDIEGGPGNDTICGLGGADRIRGNGGDDVVSGGSGPDQVWGGKGRDSIRGNGGDDELWGNRAADTISGGPGDDTIRGGPGDDTIRGGPGDDTCRGGPGSNEIERC